jgi:hypothetical protein
MYEFGALDEKHRRAFADHVIECEYCHNRVYSMEPIAAAFRERRSAVHLSEAGIVPVARTGLVSRFRLRVPYAVATYAAVTLLVSVGAWVVWRTQVSGSSRDSNVKRQELLAKIEVLKPPYTPPEKQVLLRGEEKAFSRAMVAYGEDDYDSAIEQLRIANELQPSNAGEVNFYLGACLVLVSRSKEAIWPLRRALESGDGPLTEKSGYYLALAYLKDAQVQPAIAELDAVIAMKGEYLVSANRLRQEISNLKD